MEVPDVGDETRLSPIARSREREEPRVPSLLQQREIEAKILAPFVDALNQRFGSEPVLEILREVVTRLAQETGRRLREESGGAPSMSTFSRAVERWQEDDALSIHLLQQDEEHLAFDVTRCRFAEMYERLGIPELGRILSCGRDAALIEGFDASFELERTGTILNGARCCDFRFRRRSL